jgi:hypothetical protein
MFLVSLFLVNAPADGFLSWLFKFVGCLDLAAALLLFLVSTVSYPLEKYFAYKAKLRQKLVN